MKQPITIRLDPEILAAARARAKEENRTLTNFLETALKEHFHSLGNPNTNPNPSFKNQKNISPKNSKRSLNAKQ